MKIKSHIQKIFAVLFLLAFFSSCTDEVIDGGGSGTTPVEAGKPVNVKFALGKAGEQTVVTKSDDNQPEVDELLFLQYSGEDLVYAWYTDEDDDFKIHKSSDDDDFEGWGAEATVHNIKLLSGSGYTVYVIANVDLDEDNGDFEEERDEDDDRGPVNITKTAIQDEFGTVTKLKAWTRNNSKFLDDEEDSDEDKYQYPDIDDDIMFGIASNTDDPNKEKPNYQYTKMATNYSESYTSVNDSKNDYTVNIAEGSTICSTLYPPYSKVTLTIVGAESFKATINVSSVELINCPKDYSLFSGYKLSGVNADLDPIKLNRDKIEVSKNTENELSSVFVYENMAGALVNKMEPFANTSLDQPGYPYTYIKVTGTYTEGENTGKVVYRFILGKNASTDCNIERNVHYNVTMTLKGDGGVNETTWTVNYDGKKEEPEKTPIIETEGFGNLDAHASVSKIIFKNMEGDCYVVVSNNSNPSDIDKDQYEKYQGTSGHFLYNKYAGGFDDKKKDESGNKCDVEPYKTKSGDNYYYALSIPGDEFSLDYQQISWFDYSYLAHKEISWGTNFSENAHKTSKPDAVAAAGVNKYYLHIYKESKCLKTIEIAQYPPIVVTKEIGARDDFGSFIIKGENVAYMERFDNDHDGLQDNQSWDNYGAGKDWTLVAKGEKVNKISYDIRMFNEKKGIDGNLGSEYCYWANPYGGLVAGNSRISSNSPTAWNYILDDSKKRYIIQP